MALSDNQGKLALATSFAVMTMSSTVYAQINEGSSLEGTAITTEENQNANQAAVRSVNKGVKTVVKSLVFRKVFAGNNKKQGGLGIRQDDAFADAQPMMFGPKVDRAPLGLAAGEGLEGVGVWSNFSVNTIESRGGGADTETALGNLTFGIDKAFEDSLILGFSIGLSGATTESEFTVGAANLEVDTSSSGATFAPYAAYILNENVYFDLLAGVTGTETSLEQNNITAGALVSSGDQDTRTWFWGFSANYIDIIGDYGILASIGLTQSRTKTDDFIDDQGVRRIGNRRRDSLLTLGAEVGRPIGDGTYIPYVFGYMEKDLIVVPRGGQGSVAAERADAGLRFGGGVDALYSENMTVSAELAALALKADYFEVGGTLNIRWDF